jgi:adenylate cyclase
LPFANLSNDPEQEYFSDGIADDIVTELSRSHALFVIARNSSFTYRGKSVDPRLAARELGVRYVMTGSVRRTESSVRIGVQLIDAIAGNQIWAERYDRSIADAFLVQDEITAHVSGAIGPAIEQSERKRVARKPSLRLDAWECYHRGMWHYANVEMSELKKATDFFHRAIELDPNFSQAYAALAAAVGREATFYRPDVRGENVARAVVYGQKAVSIDPADATGHSVLADALMMSGRHAEAICEADLAVSLDPNSSYAHFIQGAVRTWGGQPREAIVSLDTAARLSPFDPRMPARLHTRARAYYFAQDYEAAIATTRQLTRVAPNYPQAYATLIAAYGQTGRIDEACAIMVEALEHIGQGFWFFLSLPPDKILELRSEDREHLLDGFRKAGISERASMGEGSLAGQQTADDPRKR